LSANILGGDEGLYVVLMLIAELISDSLTIHIALRINLHDWC
jgi:hypothetical protein